MYSALHHEGQRLYDLARAGVEVERGERPVTIYDLTVLAWEPPCVRLSVTCSKGTYIRSLAHDLGRALGCGASLQALERTRSGPFRIRDANSMEVVEEALRAESAAHLLLSIDYPLASWPEIRLDAGEEQDILLGKAITGPQEEVTVPERAGEKMFWPQAAGMARAYGAGGRFLAVVVRDVEAGVWRPQRVFP
jgi:tRNA pseudouridine55 synthase